MIRVRRQRPEDQDDPAFRYVRDFDITIDRAEPVSHAFPAAMEIEDGLSGGTYRLVGIRDVPGGWEAIVPAKPEAIRRGLGGMEGEVKP